MGIKWQAFQLCLHASSLSLPSTVGRGGVGGAEHGIYEPWTLTTEGRLQTKLACLPILDIARDFSCNSGAVSPCRNLCPASRRRNNVLVRPVAAARYSLAVEKLCSPYKQTRPHSVFTQFQEKLLQTRWRICCGCMGPESLSSHSCSVGSGHCAL